MKTFRRILKISAALFICYGLLMVLSLGTGSWVNFIWGLAGMILLALDFLLPFILKAPKALKYAVFAVIAAVLLHFGSFEFQAIEKSFSRPEADADWVIVLGAHVKNGQPSGVFKNRIDAAADYCEANSGAVLIASGGKGSDEEISEAAAAARYLNSGSRAIDTEILLEDRSTSTFENISFSGNIILSEGGSLNDRVVIISSAFHLYRASLFARSMGFTDVSYMGSDSEILFLPQYYAREYAAYVKEFILDRILR